MSIERATPAGPEWSALAAPHLARYVFACERSRGKRVLDAGCGTGYGAALLAAQTGGAASEVIGVDIDPGTIHAAEKTFPFPNLKFVADDCETLASLAAPFDLICSFENIEHLRQPEKFLAAAARLLAPDGLLLISSPDRSRTPPFINGKPANPFHLAEWSRPEFAEMLGRHFESVELRTQVQSHASTSRMAAVKALRQGLNWSNPVGAFLWRRLGRTRRDRSWKAAEALGAGTLADFPIVEAGLAPIWGTAYCHFALCRGRRART